MKFDNSYAKLPPQFHTRMAPTPVRQPRLIKVNAGLADALGMDANFLASPEGVEILAGNRVADGAEPIAMAYGGHQFGSWSGQLGDGRAILLGEALDRTGSRFDIQLKGSGQTPYSRNGDGRAWLGPVLREYVVSEAMAALNIPTTRALAAVTTGEKVVREELLPGAILTRVAKAHIRVGTFELFAWKKDADALRILADHVIDRFYPSARDAEQPYLALFENVLARQAELVAKWMGVGFIHGVMNTDNMSVAGETIDYGPCAFMDAYHPDTVFSYIDHAGRYAYANQPAIAHWNLARFASATLSLMAPDGDGDAGVARVRAVLDSFEDRFWTAWEDTFRAKLGLTTKEDGDGELIQDLLEAMAANSADFTLTFRRLSTFADAESNGSAVRSLFTDPAAFDAWATAWQARLGREGAQPQDARARMDAVNPAYIPRNHRIEQMIEAARKGDYAPFEALLDVLARPFEDQPDFADYQVPPLPDEVVQQTFCGT